MPSVKLKEDQIVVSQNDFGLLVDEFIRNELRPGRSVDSNWMNEHIRRWWPSLEDYYRQHIITAIEVALIMDEPPRYDRQELRNRDMWSKIVKDLRPAHSSFTVKYQCSKCKKKNLKLWRDYQTFASHVELECAACLAPDVTVDDKGMAQESARTFANGNSIPGERTDQLKGKVPAIPVGDTYWGYTSVPSQDVEWWVALPTYSAK